MEERDGIFREEKRETAKAGVEQSGEGLRRWGSAAALALARCGHVRLWKAQASPPLRTAAPRAAWHLGLPAVCQSSLLRIPATRSSAGACLTTASVCFLLPPNPGRWGLLLEFVV